MLPKWRRALEEGRYLGERLQRAFRSPDPGGIAPTEKRLIVKARSGDPEHHEEPRDHDTAGGQQAVVDALPWAADALAPEPHGGPHRGGRPGHADPRGHVQREYDRIELVAQQR